MEILYFFFGSGIGSLLFFGFFIYLIASTSSLKRRVSLLEAKMKNSAVAPSVATSNVNVVAPVVNNLQNTPQYIPPVQNNDEERVEISTDQFSKWLKEDWLMKLGAFIFIIGFGWFVSYAFANNWIGPVGRITIGIVAGILLMTFGFRWMMKYVSQGAIFMALGAGMVILTIFAGRSIYGFFTPLSAVAFDFVIISFIAFASYKFNVRSLAGVGQVLAFLTPLLVAGKTDVLFLFTYLFFVSLATMFLVGMTGWRELITSSLIFVGLYSAPYLLGLDGTYRLSADLVLNFVYAFSLLYLFAGMSAVIRSGVQDEKNEMVLAVLNGLFLFVWIYSQAPEEWAVFIFSAWAFIFAMSSFVTIWSGSGNATAFYAYGSVAVAYLGAATALQLDGAVLTIAFIIEIFLLVMIVSQLTRNLEAATSTAWLFVVPMFLSLTSIADYSNARDPFSEDFFVLALLSFALIVSGRYLISGSSQENKESPQLNSSSLFLVLGMLYLGYIVWQLVHIFMQATPDFATMVTRIIFTVVGLIAYFNGLYGKDVARRTYGVVLIAFVVGRLLMVDVWDMELFGRVVTFIAIGVLLMSTAFVTRKNKHEIQ